MSFRWRNTPFQVNPNLRLPQELVEEIIFYLDDATSLMACTRVCFAWVPASRRPICLNISTHARATELRDLLRSPYETFTSNVTKLLLAERVSASKNNDLDPPAMAQYHHILNFLKSKGVKLQHATIDEKSLLAKILFAHFPNVPALSFIFLPPPVTIPVNNETECLNFLRMVQAFHHIHSISLIAQEGYRWDVTIPDLRCASGGSLNIAVVHLTGAWNPSLTIWRGLVTFQGRQSRPLTTNARPHVMMEYVSMSDAPKVLTRIEWNLVGSSSRPSLLNGNSI